MEQLNTFLDIKRDTYNYYKNAIYDIDGLTVSEVPAYSRNNHWMVLIKINKKIYKCDREGLMNLLARMEFKLGQPGHLSIYKNLILLIRIIKLLWQIN